ncbi:ring-cleaving dioxygenase [Paenibacillus sp.]|jgi:glyoxalase family protein|uniref:ring-cleaving dioxygenase n=1 Tax=Paenibacillus sp. TaxID=58172 RepID=UPI00281F6096|nr:ring-cleaving dioxygenase [Paenibacillus sp.]MDR0267635.1 ring-cleaving dioxygenase [Paenibacillus sp.]
MLKTAGIHHITAFVNDAQQNVDFYAGVLGLRLVKKTINFDAPEVYHLYFGDENGSPGTIITFFPQDNARTGKIGGGQVSITVYAIPEGSIDFWKKRLDSFGIHHETTTRFGETFLRFFDPSGLQIELVERKEGAASRWSFNGVSFEHAIKGFGGAMLSSVSSKNTILVLEKVLGLDYVAEEDGLIRFKGYSDIGNIIDVNAENATWGDPGAGTVHHIAWRARDYEEHEKWRELLAEIGFQPTQVIDRQYFNAIYFREPGGILFEIATDPPGFARDEDKEEMGTHLMLPEWYEPQRELIEQILPKIEVREVEEI